MNEVLLTQILILIERRLTELEQRITAIATTAYELEHLRLQPLEDRVEGLEEDRLPLEVDRNMDPRLRDPSFDPKSPS